MSCTETRTPRESEEALIKSVWLAGFEWQCQHLANVMLSREKKQGKETG